jgi:hypothetical protein
MDEADGDSGRDGGMQRNARMADWIRIQAHLPRNASGKVLKRDLRQR